MAQTVHITLTIAGADTGPFDLYSNVDGFAVPFETGIAKLDLEAGYTSFLVPDDAMVIRVQSDNALCENYIDLIIVTTTTTSSTSSTSTTSTSSTSTTTSSEFFYLATVYDCGVCAGAPVVVDTVVSSDVSLDSFIGNWYPDETGDFMIQITDTAPPSVPIYTLDLEELNGYDNCEEVPCIA